MEDFDLRKLIQPLLRWWWLILGSTAIAATATALTMSRQPPIYRSTTTLMVGTALSEPNPTGTELSLAGQLAAAYADIARRAPVYEATMEALGLARLPTYSVRQVPNTQIIEITVLAGEPVLAQAVAAELVTQLVRATPAGSEQTERDNFVEQQLDQLEASITETDEEIERLNRELETMFSARQIADTNTQITALETKKSALQANYAAMLANTKREATNTISILEAANLPTRPEQNNVLLYILTSGMLGFVLAAAGAYTIQYLDDTLRNEQDVRERLALPTLGEIPAAARRAREAEHLLLTANDHSPAIDAYAGLRLALFRAAADRPLRHILISSPGTGDDHAVVAANFSMELARAGYNVILVDANLHRPAQQRLFRLKNHVGLTTLLQDTQLESDGVLQPTATPGLLVLTSGPLPRNSVQLLSSKRMQSVLATLQEKADIVVIDTSPIAATADASVLAAQVDCVLPVITAGHTKGELAKQAVAILHQIGTNVLGVVLTGLRPGQITYRAGAAYRVAAIHTPGPRVAKGQGLFHLNSARKPQPSQSVNGASDGETQDSPNPNR